MDDCILLTPLRYGKALYQQMLIQKYKEEGKNVLIIKDINGDKE